MATFGSTIAPNRCTLGNTGNATIYVGCCQNSAADRRAAAREFATRARNTPTQAGCGRPSGSGESVFGGHVSGGCSCNCCPPLSSAAQCRSNHHGFGGNTGGGTGGGMGGNHFGGNNFGGNNSNCTNGSNGGTNVGII